MIEQLFASPWPWIIGGFLLAGAETVVAGVYLLWIGLGAVAVGLILALAPGLSPAWQALLFAVAMLGSIGIGFAIQRRSGRSRDASYLNRELEAMIGYRYVALSGFAGGRGRIRVQDTSFAAVSEDAVAAGDMVEVIAIVEGRPKVAKVQAEIR